MSMLSSRVNIPHTTHLMWFLAVSDETEANEEVFHIMETEADDMES